MKMGKILVPHDGSHMSDKALMYAADLSKALDSEITILYVIEEAEIPPTLLLGNDRLKFAKDNKIDLIVMGRRRLEGVSKIVVALGSVARKVSERAFCPVMFVH